MTVATNQDLIALAVSSFSHVLQLNKQYTFSQFAYQISKSYSLSTPKIKAIYSQLNSKKGSIKRTKNSIKYTIR